MIKKALRPFAKQSSKLPCNCLCLCEWCPRSVSFQLPAALNLPTTDPGRRHREIADARNNNILTITSNFELALTKTLSTHVSDVEDFWAFMNHDNNIGAAKGLDSATKGAGVWTLSRRASILLCEDPCRRSADHRIRTQRRARSPTNVERHHLNSLANLLNSRAMQAFGPSAMHCVIYLKKLARG